MANSGGSWGSTKKSTRRNKEVGRQRKKKSRDMEKKRQSNTEYKRLRIQRTNSKKISGPLCGTIYH